jgi:hypothetical protein
MSKITLILFALSLICYLANWILVSTVFGIIGFLFELFYYISMYGDYKNKN